MNAQLPESGAQRMVMNLLNFRYRTHGQARLPIPVAARELVGAVST